MRELAIKRILTETKRLRDLYRDEGWDENYDVLTAYGYNKQGYSDDYFLRNLCSDETILDILVAMES